ncbi:MAG: putative quinol monooxygenase [Novosphingobium sp.]
MITMIARMKVGPENAAEYEALLDHVTAKTLRHEPGVAYYAWSKSADEPNTYVVIEVYENAEVHAAHMASPWVRESLPKSVALVDGGFDIQQYLSEGSAPVTLRHKA